MDEVLFRDILETETVFEEMLALKEDSPYHREENVKTHTLMVCEQYRGRVSPDEEWFWLGLFACLLHDVSKPECKAAKKNQELGLWSFHGHDIRGAARATDMLVRKGVSAFDIYRISWMIEHHTVFWSVKDAEKKLEMARFLVRQDCFLPFRFFMISDDQGRICDERKLDSEDHFDRFESEFVHTLRPQKALIR